MVFNLEEREVNDKLLEVMRIIEEDWDLLANHQELVIGIHTIQRFIIQHMLQRTNPEQWGNWYGSTTS